MNNSRPPDESDRDALMRSCLSLASIPDRIPEAISRLEAAIAAHPAFAPFRSLLGGLYRLENRFDDALTQIKLAVDLAADDLRGLLNLGLVQRDLGEEEAALAAFLATLARAPDYWDAHLGIAEILLARGEWEPGWIEYEARLPPERESRAGMDQWPVMAAPKWNGMRLPRGRILLIADQGYGDVVMFARYLPWAMSRAKSITVATSPELKSLLQRHFPSLRYITRWDDAAPYVAFCPFSGLPRLHFTRADSIPAPTPYMFAEPGKLESWRARLNDVLPAGLKRIGIAWAGRPTHNNDRNRSISLEMLAPFGAIPGVVFVAVQKGPAVAQTSGWRGPAPLVALDAQLETFEDTAAVLNCLDLLVCVDTSVGHIAGAMNCPAWIMLPYAPDWRWMMQRGDSPWYPSLRLFRQDAPKAWPKLIERVAGELAAFAASSG